MNIIEWTLQVRLLVALALGFLVGLERESTRIGSNNPVLGGVRTHPIISMLGFGCAWFHTVGLSLMLPVGLGGMIVLTGASYVSKTREGQHGSTTEISALLTYVVGALALLADVWIAMALAIVNTLLLSEKSRLEKLVADLDRVDFLATVKFLLVTVIILPILPNEEYTMFHINPSSVWKVVILVSTIGFVGYALSKRFGENVGLWLSGVLGGIVSSTAVTIASGRTAEKMPELAGSALKASLLAGSVMYIRTLALIAFLSPMYAGALWWQCVALAGIGVAMSFWQSRTPSSVEHHGAIAGLQNPFEITPALMFGFLFVILSVVTTLVQTNAGSTGVLTLAGIVGVTDITPFILSLLRNPDAVKVVVLRAILIALMSNTVIKGFYFAFLVRSARRETALRFGIWALCHIPFIVFSM